MALTEPVDPHLRRLVIARLFTDAFLPALEHAAGRNPFLTAGFDGVVRFSFASENIGADMVFKKGTVQVRSACCGRADLEVCVSARKLIESIDGGKLVFPITGMHGAWRIDLLTSLAGLTAAAILSAAPKGAMPYAGLGPLGIRTVIEAGMRSLAVVGAVDPQVFKVIQITAEKTVSLRLRGGDDFGTLVFGANTVSFERCFQGEPTTTVVFDSMSLIGRIMEKKAAPMEAYSGGAINYSGESSPLVMTGYLFLRLCDYIGFHPWLDGSKIMRT